jgi:sugar phosphate isomerase/epimerase
MERDIPLVSIGFDGYDLEQTLAGLSKTSSKHIILCCIDGFTKHVVPEEMTREKWQKTKDLVEKYGLTFFGLFGHCNISDPDDLEKLKRRMEYTRFMGGDYIDTNAGPRGEERGFFENIGKVIDMAEALDLTVCLETHGDMLITGAEALKIFDKIDSPRIRLSYDPANVFFYTRGKTNPVSDVEFIYEHIGMIHFKGVRSNEDGTAWGFPPASEAVIDYESFFELMKVRAYDGMIAVELEGRFRFEEGKGFLIDPVWPEAQVVDLYDREIAYLQKKLAWMA